MRTVPWVGAFYNPHLAPDLLSTGVQIDHLAMADPPGANDSHWPAIRERYTLLLHDYLGQLSEPLGPAGVEREYGARARRDMGGLAELFADDIEWHVPGRSAIAGHYRGKDAVMAYVRRRQESRRRHV